MAVINSDYGKNTMDAIRVHIDSMLAEENRLLEVRENNRKNSMTLLTILLAISSVVSFFAGFFMIRNMNRLQSKTYAAMEEAVKANEVKSRSLR